MSKGSRLLSRRLKVFWQLCREYRRGITGHGGWIKQMRGRLKLCCIDIEVESGTAFYELRYLITVVLRKRFRDSDAFIMSIALMFKNPKTCDNRDACGKRHIAGRPTPASVGEIS